MDVSLIITLVNSIYLIRISDTEAKKTKTNNTFLVNIINKAYRVEKFDKSP